MLGNFVHVDVTEVPTGAGGLGLTRRMGGWGRWADVIQHQWTRGAGCVWSGSH